MHIRKQKFYNGSKLSKHFENLQTKSDFSTDVTDCCGCNFQIRAAKPSGLCSLAAPDFDVVEIRHDSAKFFASRSNFVRFAHKESGRAERKQAYLCSRCSGFSVP